MKDRWRNAYTSIKQSYLDLVNDNCNSAIKEYIKNINPDAVDKRKNPFFKKWVKDDAESLPLKYSLTDRGIDVESSSASSDSFEEDQDCIREITNESCLSKDEYVCENKP